VVVAAVADTLAARAAESVMLSSSMVIPLLPSIVFVDEDDVNASTIRTSSLLVIIFVIEVAADNEVVIDCSFGCCLFDD